jgi:hypothetical protein
MYVSSSNKARAIPALAVLTLSVDDLPLAPVGLAVALVLTSQRYTRWVHFKRDSRAASETRLPNRSEAETRARALLDEVAQTGRGALGLAQISLTPFIDGPRLRRALETR